MGNGLEGHFGGALLLASLNLVLLFFSNCRFRSGGCGISVFLILFLLRSGNGFRSSLNGNFLFLFPHLRHLNQLKLGNLVDVVFDANAELSFGARVVSSSAFALADIVLCDRGGKTSHEAGVLTVVDGQRKAAFLVVEVKLLHEREFLAYLEEVWVCLHFLLSSIFSFELVIKGDGQVVVVVHDERLHSEVRGDHGAVEGSSSGNALKSVEGARELLLLKDLLADGLDDWGTGTITNQFDEVNLVRLEA